MSRRRPLGKVVGVVCLSMAAAAAAAVDTTTIQAVQQRCANRTPSAADTEQIEAFVNQAITAVLAAVDPAEAIAAREQIIQFRGWDKGLAPYARVYVLAAKKRLGQAFEQVAGWADAQARLRTERNLIIVTARLGSTEMRDVAVGRLKHPDTAVRYWAVKALTHQHVVDELNNELTGDAEAARAILQALQEHLPTESQGVILEQMASFAARLKAPQEECVKLLSAVADKRSQAYEQWTVTSERSDAAILEALAAAQQFTTSPQDKTRLAQAFGQLYSYVIQRRILGDAVLKDLDKHQLKYTIVTVGQGALGGLLGQPYDEISQAAVRDDMAALQAAHDALLGSAGRSGLLPTKLKYQYAHDGGSASPAPKTLKAPPAAKTASPDN